MNQFVPPSTPRPRHAQAPTSLSGLRPAPMRPRPFLSSSQPVVQRSNRDLSMPPPPRPNLSRPTATPRPPSRPPSRPQPPPPKPNAMFFCTSLKSPDPTRPWASSAASLLETSRSDPPWTATHLGSHDLAVRLPAANDAASDTVVRFLLLSSADDVASETLRQKLQRLEQRKSGLCVVLLLMSSNSSSSALQQIQQTCQTAAVLPLTAVETLPATVAAFVSQLQRGRNDEDSEQQYRRLVRSCVVDNGRGRLLTDAAVDKLLAAAREQQGENNIFAKLAVMCTEANRKTLTDLVGPEDADRMIRFWKGEE